MTDQAVDAGGKRGGIPWRAIQRRGALILAGWWCFLLLVALLSGNGGRFLGALGSEAFERPLSFILRIYLSAWILGGAWELITALPRLVRRVAGAVRLELDQPARMRHRRRLGPRCGAGT